MVNEATVSFIELFEGYRLHAYRDAGGIWTVGYGETGPHVQEGTTMPLDAARVFLNRSAQRAADCVKRHVLVPLREHQEAALTSLVFNIGCGAFRKSSLLRILNAGDYNGALLEFPKWNKAGGKVLPGLVRRRAAEQHLFSDGWE